MFIDSIHSSALPIARLTAGVAIVLALTGCAHPISIEARTVPDKAVQSQKKAAYYISDALKQKQVTSAGGGGDKVSYFPYRDFERTLRGSLSAFYSDVQALSSASAPPGSGVSYVYVPLIETSSSSPSPFTWPPTSFKLKVSVDVFDAQSQPVAKLTVTGDGAAEFSEFKSDFGLAGRKAVEAAGQALLAEIKKQDGLR